MSDRLSDWYDLHNGNKQAMADCFEDEASCKFCHPELDEDYYDGDDVPHWSGCDTWEEYRGEK